MNQIERLESRCMELKPFGKNSRTLSRKLFFIGKVVRYDQTHV